jgi:hypothetical protein
MGVNRRVRSPREGQSPCAMTAVCDTGSRPRLSAHSGSSGRSGSRSRRTGPRACAARSVMSRRASAPLAATTGPITVTLLPRQAAA